MISPIWGVKLLKPISSASLIDSLTGSSQGCIASVKPPQWIGMKNSDLRSFAAITAS